MSSPSTDASQGSAKDPYLAASLPWTNRAARVAWAIGYTLLVRFSPRPLHAWRAAVLRAFGATLGANCHIYPGARIWAPWNLLCEDAVGIADGAVIYNPAPIRIGSHGVVSQDAYLCGATHDIDDPAFPMISAPITIGRYAWICARAVVCSGVEVGEGAVLGLASVATRNLEPWTVYGGAPARVIRARRRSRP
ncbi:MAG: putative colanic acid biosynthesis acetyltransferase [Pseudomonadota bacterium]|nr:putative colanic acid biosynthesis acetyltransferase [Pseudomonadota bacterium]